MFPLSCFSLPAFFFIALYHQVALQWNDFRNKRHREFENLWYSAIDINGANDRVVFCFIRSPSFYHILHLIAKIGTGLRRIWYFYGNYHKSLPFEYRYVPCWTPIGFYIVVTGNGNKVQFIFLCIANLISFVRIVRMCTRNRYLIPIPAIKIEDS